MYAESNCTTNFLLNRVPTSLGNNFLLKYHIISFTTSQGIGKLAVFYNYNVLGNDNWQ